MERDGLVPSIMHSMPLRGSFSLPSLAEAGETLSEAEEIHEVRTLQEKGNQAVSVKDFDEAIRNFDEALEIDNRNTSVIHSRSMAYLEMGHLRLAEDDADTIISLSPRNAVGYTLSGIALERQYRNTEALDAFLTSLDLDPDNADMLTNHIVSVAATFCEMSDTFIESLKEMDAYKKLSEVGVYLFQNKRFLLCIKILEAAQKFQTNQKGITMRILLTKANAHTMLKHKEQAINLYVECLSIAVANHDQLYQTKSLVNIATLYLENGDTHLAIVYYEKLLHLKAELLEEVGNDDNLPDFWTKELQSGLHLNLSIAYKQIGNMYSAVHHAKKYIKFIEKYDVKGKSRAESYHNTGMLNEILGKYDEALKDYKKYLDISKHNADNIGMSRAYGCLGGIYAALHNWSISITYHEQYIHMAEKSDNKKLLPIAHEMMADTYMKMTKYDLAIKHYNKMIDSDVGDDGRMHTTGLRKLGNAYKELDKFQHSIYYYKQACEMAEELYFSDIQIIAEYNLACIQQHSTQMKDIEMAKKYFEKLIPFFEAKLLQHKEEDTHCPAEYEKQLIDCYDGIQMVLSKLGAKIGCLQFAEVFRRRCVTQLANFLSTSSGHEVTNRALSRDAWTLSRMSKVVSQQNATVLFYSLLDYSLLLWVLQPGYGLSRFYMGGLSTNCSIRSQIHQLLMELQKDIDWKAVQNECENRALPLSDVDLEHMQRKNEHLSRNIYLLDKPDTHQSTKKKKSIQRQLYDILLAPVEDILMKLGPNSHIIIVPDKELCHCPFTVLEDYYHKLFGERFHVTYIPCLFLLDRVVRNELDYLRDEDQLLYDRVAARKGGAGKIIQRQKQDMLSSYRINPSEATYNTEEEIFNLRTISNPRFVTSGRNRTPEKHEVSQMLVPLQETTFKSLDARTLSNDLCPYGPIHDRLSVVPHQIGKSVSTDKMMSVYTFSTLATRTSTDTDITNSTNTVPLFQQISCKARCVVYGCPKLPDRLQLRGKMWKPFGELKNAQKEAEVVARVLDVDPVTHDKASKIQFLQDVQQATVLHIATHACLKEGLLAFSMDPDYIGEEPPVQSSYIVSTADIHNLTLNAQLVVLSCGYNPSRQESLTSLSLPAVFLSAGAQCVLVTQWLVPDNALQKFFHHFYMTLQDGCLLSEAVKTAMEKVREDDRFAAICNWSPFALFGKDVLVNVSEIRKAMLDQVIDKVETAVEEETRAEYLNPLAIIPHVSTKEENFAKLQQQLGNLVRHNSKQPSVIGELIDLLDAALKRLHTEENNKQTYCLSSDITDSDGALGLLKMLGFHFQAKGALLNTPYVVFPHWDKDEMLIPAYDALRAITELLKNVCCSQAFCDIVPISQDKISMMVDLMSITKHASDIQLKINDLSIRPLWLNTNIKNLLVAAGYHQIGVLLNFNKIPRNRQMLTALLQLLLAVSIQKSQILLYRLDVNLLGRSSASRQSLYDSIDQIRLPSLTPLILPRNQLCMSTPWMSVIERDNEMEEKMRFAKTKSNLDEGFQEYVERARTWHQMTIVAQANESLDKVGRPKTTPLKVKVIPGGNASMDRIEIDKEKELNIPEIDERRDYASCVLQQRIDNIDVRHKDEVLNLYRPYVNS